jgi:putative peptidoglycan lipid II flippase
MGPDPRLGADLASPPASDVVGRHRRLVLRTFLVSSLTLSSRLIGFARESLAAFLFGDASAVNDAFVTAWRVPNLFRSLLGEGAMTTALQAAITKADAEGGDAAGASLFRSIARVVAGFVVVLCVVLMLAVFLAPDRMPITGFPWLGAHPEPVRELTLRMLPFVVLVCLSAVCSGALNVRGHFLAPSFAPVAMNIWWIALLVMVAAHFGWRRPAGSGDAAEFGRQLSMARCLAWGVLVAGAILLLVQIPALVRERLVGGDRSVASAAPRVPGREAAAVLWASAPLALGAAVYQVNVMIDGWMAVSLLDQGGATTLYYATRIQQFPMSLVSIAATSAVFPALMALGHRRELTEVRSLHDRTQLAIAFVAIPASLGLLVFAEPIVTVVFRHGAFGHEGVLRASAGLRCLTLAVLPAGATGLVARTFYALGDYKTPVRISIAMLVANVALNLLFVVGLGMDVAGLALSTAITAWGNLLLLGPALRRKLGLPASAPDFGPRIVRVAGAALASTLLARGAFELFGGEKRPTLALFASIGIAIALFAAAAELLRIPEWAQVRARLRGASDRN